MSSLDEAEHTGCAVDPSVTDASGHIAVCLVDRPWLIWNQFYPSFSRMTIREQSTRWRTSVISLRPSPLVRTPCLEKVAMRKSSAEAI